MRIWSMAGPRTRRRFGSESCSDRPRSLFRRVERTVSSVRGPDPRATPIITGEKPMSRSYRNSVIGVVVCLLCVASSATAQQAQKAFTCPDNGSVIIPVIPASGTVRVCLNGKSGCDDSLRVEAVTAGPDGDFGTADDVIVAGTSCPWDGNMQIKVQIGVGQRVRVRDPADGDLHRGQGTWSAM